MIPAFRWNWLPLLVLAGCPQGAMAAAAGQQNIDAAVARAKASMQIDPRQAMQQARAAEGLADTLPASIDRDRAVAAAEWLQGEAAYRLNLFDEATPHIRDALSLARRVAPSSKLLGDVLLSSGSLHGGRGEASAAFSDYRAAHDIYRRIRDSRGRAIALLCIAALYGDANDFSGSLKYLDQALEVYRGDPGLLVSIYNNRASTLQDLGRLAESERDLRQAFGLARELGSPLLEARILGNIARVRLKASDLGGAQTAVDQAMARANRAEASSWRPPLLAIAAQLAFQRHDNNRAASLIGQRFAGLDLSTTTVAFREAHETAYNIYRALGDDRLAVAHLGALKRLDDQATKLATSANIALAAARFDFANQELKIATLQRDEANRKAAYEQARARTQRTIFMGSAATAAVIFALLTFGLFTIRRSRNQVRSANADLAVTNTALGKALAAKTEFLATTSHEIRTPLNGILGMTQVMLADQALAPDTRDRLRVVHGAGVTMRALVDDILDVAKMESGKLTVEEAPFDLAQTVDEAARMWREQAEAKGIAFALDLTRAPHGVMGDAARLRQIVFNLLSNALKFTAKGRVSLAVAAEGDEVVLAVEDTGIGIAAAKREEIFESFRQADAGTTRQFGGTGLGLSICRNLAEAMGGTIDVASEEGRGSTFTLRLPMRPVVLAAEEERAAAVCGGVVILDRNPIARAMLKTLVSGRGCTPVLAADKDDALRALAQGATHLLVDQGAIAGDPDPAACALRLAEAADWAHARSVLLWAGEVPDGVAAAGFTRILAKPMAGTALLAALFDGQATEGSATALVSQAA